MKDPELNLIDDLATEICKGNLAAAKKLEYAFFIGCPEVMVTKKLFKHSDLNKDVEKRVLKFLSAESKKGNIYATAFVGFMYCWSYGVKKADPAKGIPLIQKAVAENCLLGFWIMARLYVYGIKDFKKFEVNIPKGIELLKRGEAQNCPNCIFTLGRLYEEGAGPLERNIVEAKKYFEQAAKLGYFMAISKVTQTGEGDVASNPFFFYSPKNLDFTFELKPTRDKDGLFLSVSVTIIYTGSINIPQRIFTTTLGSGDTCRYSFLKKYDYDDTKVGSKAIGELLRYHLAKKVSEQIRDADTMIMDQLSKAPLQTAPANTGYPEIFFPQPPAPQAVQITPQLAMQIMQMVQQDNAELFASLAAMCRRFQKVESQTIEPQAAVQVMQALQQDNAATFAQLVEMNKTFQQKAQPQHSPPGAVATVARK